MYTLAQMKLIGIAVLSVASIAVLLEVVLPVILTRVLGLGIDIPGHWGRTGRVYGPLSYPWVSLLAGLVLLSVFGWGIWKLEACRMPRKIKPELAIKIDASVL